MRDVYSLIASLFQRSQWTNQAEGIFQKKSLDTWQLMDGREAFTQFQPFNRQTIFNHQSARHLFLRSSVKMLPKSYLLMANALSLSHTRILRSFSLCFYSGTSIEKNVWQKMVLRWPRILLLFSVFAPIYLLLGRPMCRDNKIIYSDGEFLIITVRFEQKRKISKVHKSATRHSKTEKSAANDWNSLCIENADKFLCHKNIVYPTP